MNFASINLHPTVMDGIRAMRYTVPTPLQSQAIPPALEGRDVIGLGRAGTGKTVAYMLAMLHRLRSEEKEGVRAIIIAPTPEQAEQTLELTKILGEKTGLECLGVFGGVSLPKQLRELRYRPAIIVTCPERLLSHLWKGSIKLMDLEVLVIDDANVLSERGLLTEVGNILGYMDHPHQTMLFSTTVTDGIRRLVQDFLRDPVTIQVDRSLPEKVGTSTRYRLEQYLKRRQRKRPLR